MNREAPRDTAVKLDYSGKWFTWKEPKILDKLPSVCKSVPTAEPNAEGLYELTPVQSKVLEEELQKIMDLMVQELPDESTSDVDKLLVEKVKGESGARIKNILGLNVTQRILNIHNPLNVIVECDRTPDDESFKIFVKWLNCVAMKRSRDRCKFTAQLANIPHFDRVLKQATMRFDDVKIHVKPHYKFSECPPKLKTNYKVDKLFRRPTQVTVKNNHETDTADTENGDEKPEKDPESKLDESVKEVKTAESDSKTVNKDSSGDQKTKDNETVKKVEQKSVINKTANKTKGKVANNNKATNKASPKIEAKKSIKKSNEVFKKPANRPPPYKNKLLNDKGKKQSDFDELNDEDILAIMSDAIVVDECAGSDEEV